MAFPDIFDAETRERTTLPENQIEEAIKNGTHAFESSARVNVVSPSGEVGNVPADEIQKFLGEGYKIETPSLRALNEAIESEKGIGGVAKTFIRNVADAGTMGIGGIVANKTDDPFDVAKRAASNQNNPISSSLGQITGTIGSLFYGGPLFRAVGLGGSLAERATANALAKGGVEVGSQALAKRIIAKTITNTAKYGAEGALLSAPIAGTELALGDPEAAGETLLAGGGIGSVFGLAGQALKGAATGAKATYGFGKEVGMSASKRLGIDTSKIAERFKPDVVIEGVKDSQAAKALGFTKRFYNEQKSGKFQPNALGPKRINEITDYFLENNLIKVGERATDLQARIGGVDGVGGLVQTWGQKVGNVAAKLDEAGIATFNPSKVQQRIFNELEPIYNDPLFPSMNNRLGDVYQKFDDLIASVGGDAGNISFARAQELKGKLVMAKKQAAGNTAVYNEALGIVTEELEKAVDSAVTLAAKKPVLAAYVEKYPEYKRVYGIMKDALKGIEDKVGVEQGNKLISPTTAAAGLGGAVLGGSPAALAAAAVNKARLSFGDQAASVGIHNIQKMMAKNGAKIATIKEAIRGVAHGGKSILPTKGPSSIESVYALQNLLGLDRTDKKSKSEMLSDIQAKISSMQEDPEKLAGVISRQIAGVEEHAPDTMAAYSGKVTQALKYLDENIPKAPETNSIFDKVTWKPSDRELAAFERKTQVVMDPLSVINEIQRNTLTKEHIHALQTVYPKIYESLQKKTYEALTEDASNIPYSKRLKLSILLNVAIERNADAKRVQSLQRNFIQDNKDVKPGANSKITIGQNTATDFQKSLGL